jgi:hypothetical protein
VSLGQLVAEPARAVVAKLITAHYDPEGLGLREVRFTLAYTQSNLQVKASAEGSWQKDLKTPVVEVKSLHRMGELQTPPKAGADAGVGGQMWLALRYQLQNLLEGLGAGFLSQRLRHFRDLEGKSELRDGKLVLTYAEETGETEVVVGRGYVVERVTHRSPKGVTRWMEYGHRLESGRNLVTRALYQYKVDDAAQLSPRAKKLAAGAASTLFEISYVRVGRFLLPAVLHKASGQDDVRAVITYSRVAP